MHFVKANLWEISFYLSNIVDPDLFSTPLLELSLKQLLHKGWETVIFFMFLGAFMSYLFVSLIVLFWEALNFLLTAPEATLKGLVSIVILIILSSFLFD